MVLFGGKDMARRRYEFLAYGRYLFWINMLLGSLQPDQTKLVFAEGGKLKKAKKIRFDPRSETPEQDSRQILAVEIRQAMDRHKERVKKAKGKTLDSQAFLGCMLWMAFDEFSHEAIKNAEEAVKAIERRENEEAKQKKAKKRK